jgi:hypothetical protein
MKKPLGILFQEDFEYDYMKGYSLYSSETSFRPSETPLPAGISTPSFRNTLPFGSGSVLPKPLVLCLSFGNFCM